MLYEKILHLKKLLETADANTKPWILKEIKKLETKLIEWNKFLAQ
jgi:hypothetical protein